MQAGTTVPQRVAVLVTAVGAASRGRSADFDYVFPSRLISRPISVVQFVFNPILWKVCV